MAKVDSQICDPAPADLQPLYSQDARPRWRSFRQLCRQFWGSTACKGSLALVDQGIVSGVNFLTSILVGRIGGPEELGDYALGFSLVVMIVSVLHALIAVPYTIYVNRLHGLARGEYAGAVLVHCGLLSLLAMLALAVWGMALSAGFGSPRLGAVIGVLAGTIPFVLLREFARRIVFADLNAGNALLLDLAAATLQLGGLAVLSCYDRLSAVSTTLAVGLASAAAAVPWLLLARHRFVVRRDRVVPALRQNSTFGGWVFAGQMVANLNSDMFVLWLLAFALGNTATGVFAACMTIAQFSNPVIIGLSQILTPRIAQAYGQGRRDETRRVVGKATLVLGLTMSGFCLVVIGWGGTVMELLYGELYRGYEHTSSVLAASILASAIGLAAGSGLWAMERPQVNFVINLLGLVVTAAVAFVLVHPLGVLGVACGLLAGQLVTSAIRCEAFARLSRRPASHPGKT